VAFHGYKDTIGPGWALGIGVAFIVIFLMLALL
jgi:hypothetical protein